MNKLTFCLAAAVVGGAVVSAAACNSSAEATSAPGTGDARTQDAKGGGEAGLADGGATPAVIQANAIVLVHAASFPALRICFEGAPNDQPQPNLDVMPDSNVVGVDIGTAVRLPPHPGGDAGTLGRAFVYPEAALRNLYPAFGGEGPTCGTLLTTTGPGVAVGSVDDDLSSGVHALVLTGCQGAAEDPAASVARCGADWLPQGGNLKLSTIALTAYARMSPTTFPIQLLQLSPSLAQRSAGRALGLAFGALDGGAPLPFVEGTAPFGLAVPDPPALLDYTPADLSSYDTTGVYMTIGGPVNDAGVPIDAGADSGARELVLVQSLADIQKRSASRSLPSDWFSVASSYVVLSVGDPDPRLADGGADEDPRRALHLLAIPLASPDAPDAQ